MQLNEQLNEQLSEFKKELISEKLKYHTLANEYFLPSQEKFRIEILQKWAAFDNVIQLLSKLETCDQTTQIDEIKYYISHPKSWNYLAKQKQIQEIVKRLQEIIET